jgi:hypothetical protein
VALSQIGVPERQQPFIGIRKISSRSLSAAGMSQMAALTLRLRVTSPGVMGQQETLPPELASSAIGG